jgi:hypothetical protein
MKTEELIAGIITKPSDFAFYGEGEGETWFAPGGWGFTPIETHRDADTITRSNWTAITSDLLERFPDSFQLHHTSHWAVGWYDHLAVNTADTAAVEALAEWLDKLEGYPVADEEELSRIEDEEIWKSINDYALRDTARQYAKATDRDPYETYDELTDEQTEALGQWLREEAEHCGSEVHFPQLSALYRQDNGYWGFREARDKVAEILGHNG